MEFVCFNGFQFISKADIHKFYKITPTFTHPARWRFSIIIVIKFWIGYLSQHCTFSLQLANDQYELFE
jgi:hypothetical protein